MLQKPTNEQTCRKYPNKAVWENTDPKGERARVLQGSNEGQENCSTMKQLLCVDDCKVKFNTLRMSFPSAVRLSGNTKVVIDWRSQPGMLR